MNTKNTLIAIVALFATSATFAQVGIGTTSPNTSAALDVESTTKGFLPPRMTGAQRNAIATPAEGLSIYNTDSKCLQWYNGSGWCSTCDGDGNLRGGGFINGFQDNTTCTTKVISVTSCASVTGATLNDIVGTADGIEYDWTNATSYMGGTTTEALVEIGGQCWFRRNATVAPTAPISDAPNTGSNVWTTNISTDNGYWGYYNTATTSGASGWATTEPAAGEGLLYQWSAAMNGSTTERAQGVCPTGWHVPSDCEWMYLENTLGMSTTDQQVDNNWRSTTDEGNKLRSVGGSGTTLWNNSSGFTALLAGFRGTNGTFRSRGPGGGWWSSSESSATNAQRRSLGSSQAGVGRYSSVKANGFSVRCLKD